jgi:hypothetical protein
MPSPGGGGSGLPPRLPNDPPRLGPRALTFMEPHAATWDAGRITTSPAEVYEVAGDDFSPNHWTPDYSVSCANFIPKYCSYLFYGKWVSQHYLFYNFG